MRGLSRVAVLRALTHSGGPHPQVLVQAQRPRLRTRQQLARPLPGDRVPPEGACQPSGLRVWSLGCCPSAAATAAGRPGERRRVLPRTRGLCLCSPEWKEWGSSRRQGHCPVGALTPRPHGPPRSLESPMWKGLLFGRPGTHRAWGTRGSTWPPRLRARRSAARGKQKGPAGPGGDRGDLAGAHAAGPGRQGPSYV